MPGRRTRRLWAIDSTGPAVAKYGRACFYESFLPDSLASLALSLDAPTAGAIAKAESEVRDLQATSRRARESLGTFLLRAEGLDGVRAELNAAVAAERFDVEHCLAIHGRLVGGDSAGRVRTGQTWVGGDPIAPSGAEFVPPPPEHVDELLADLCVAVNDDRLSPLVQAALVVAQLETVRPFDDGNSRLARALAHVILRRRRLAPDFPPLLGVVLDREHDAYVAGLTDFRADHVGAWVAWFAGAALEGARLARATLAQVDAIMDAWRAKLAAGAAPRADAAAWALIDLLPAHLTITGPVAVNALGRAKAAVYQAIDQLEAAGVLTPVSASVRNRVWAAAGLREVLAGFSEPLQE